MNEEAAVMEGWQEQQQEQQQQQQQQQNGEDQDVLIDEDDVPNTENAYDAENNNNYDAYGTGDYNNPEGEEDEEDGDIFDMNRLDTMMDQPGALLMKFCPHDSSMLYPKEHKRTRTLRYACRLCRYSEDSDHPMIYRNLIKKEVGNVLHTVQGAVSDDPTLPRSHNSNCESCGHNEAVFFQSDTGQSDSLALIFVCSNCGHKWVA